MSITEPYTVYAEVPRELIEPGWKPRPPRGALALDQARAFYAQFFSFPSSAHLDAWCLWNGVTHMRYAAGEREGEFAGQFAPRCIIRADTAGAGKSLLGRLGELTCGNGNMVALPSYWGIVRGLSERNQTVIIDNYDTIRRGKTDILNLLLVGAYRHTATVMRGKQGEEELDVFGPMAVTAVGRKLRVDSDFEPVNERAVIIDVEKKAEHVTIDEWDEADPNHLARARGIGGALAKWGQDVAPDYARLRPALPGVHNRERDVWRPLVAVADLAGGEWPERARRALRVLVLGESVPPAADDDPFARLTPGERTMVEVVHVFNRAGVRSLTTVELLERMSTLPGGRRWSVPVPGDEDRQRVLRSRTMSLAADLATFGVTRSSVKVPSPDDPERYVNGWWWADIREHAPSNLPTFRPSDLDSHEDEDIPFD